ncbi:MAG: glutamate--tRNA ligase [Magnetococcales bacterium]|nr:glutamate--tRNA ligase [Magnetococcales bacterium]
MTLRTRFAPSPTGFLHIGGARTALFCHLHARHNRGQWLLRVEDTDRERSSEEAVAVIIEGLRWLGLVADEGPYFQSRRTARHLEVAHQLLDAGKAYRCYCTKEELDGMREEQRARHEKPRYDGRCRRRQDPPPPGRPAVIRFITPQGGDLHFSDRIQGDIRYPNDELDDLILVRSDGSPTYNLAVVVDDHDMGINFVVRGEDHLSNTPRQIHLFQALGWEVPVYAHMPLLHGADGAKLSKRHGAVSVLHYRDAGFLPEAVNNYLVRLGWSHKDQEVFTMEEMIRLFEIGEVGRSAAIFDLAKLEWLNGQHLRAASPERLASLLVEALQRQGIANPDPGLARAVLPQFVERAKTLVEMAEKARFYFLEAHPELDPAAAAKHLTPPMAPPLQELRALLADADPWDVTTVEAHFRTVLERHHLKTGQLAQPVRVALTGGTVSPGIFEVLHCLGRETSLARLDKAIAFLSRPG